MGGYARRRPARWAGRIWRALGATAQEAAVAARGRRRLRASLPRGRTDEALIATLRYAGPPVLTRAFRGWSGMAPGEWRRRLR